MSLEQEEQRSRRPRAPVFDDTLMTPEKRRRLRQEQRETYDKLQRDEYEHLADVRTDVNEQFKNVLFAREAVNDAKNMYAYTEKQVKKCEKELSVPRYDAHKLVHALVHKCSSSSGNFDWKTLGREAGICFNAVPSQCTFAAGRWDDPSRPVTPRKRAVRTKLNPNTAVEEKPQDAATESTQTDHSSRYAEEQVGKLRKKLKRAHQHALRESNGDATTVSVPGLDLLVQPDSYTKTIENLFYASFGVKKGEAKCQIVALREPNVLGSPNTSQPKASTLQLEPLEHHQDGLPPAKQGIISLTPRDFRRLVKAMQ